MAKKVTRVVAQFEDAPKKEASSRGWVFAKSTPVKRERDLERELAEQRKTWVIKGGKFSKRAPTRAEAKAAAKAEARRLVAKLSPEEKVALAKRLADEREVAELRKSADDPSIRVGHLLAGTEDGDVQPLGRSEGETPRHQGAISYDLGDGEKPLGAGDQPVEKTKRPSYDSVMRQRAWNGTRYDS